MDINIKSKCDIGDSVYFADFYYEWIPSKPYKVSEICTMVDSSGTKIIYTISRDNDYMCRTEDGCFKNYADCLKWCEDHNKSSSSLSIDNTK